MSLLWQEHQPLSTCREQWQRTARHMPRERTLHTHEVGKVIRGRQPKRGQGAEKADCGSFRPKLCSQFHRNIWIPRRIGRFLRPRRRHVFGSMLSETPGTRQSLSFACTNAWLARRSIRSAGTPSLYSRGSVSDAEHTPFTSPNAHCQSSGAGRLDRPSQGRLLLCAERWQTFLLRSDSEPGSLTI
jgi:hypothetical protein